ncbi:MAG TPA: hypothetical protein VFZ23_04745 [Pyrinomonadaceae bacterium]
MLIFNPRRMFGLRGIERPNNFLVRNGFTSMIASRLLAPGLSSVKVGNVGRLCQLLNCTPNDLFDWSPTGNSPLPENHALKALVRHEARPLADLLKDVPAEKLADLQAMIDELRNK